jgi:hypothetical protein
MINLPSINKAQTHNKKKVKKFVSHKVDYNKKELFQNLSNNSVVKFSPTVSFPFIKINNKKKLEFFTLKQDNLINNINDKSSPYSKPQEKTKVYSKQLFKEISPPKNFFLIENNHEKKEIKMNAHKRIRQKSDEVNKDKEKFILKDTKDTKKKKIEFNHLDKFSITKKKEQKEDFCQNKNRETPIDLLINDKFYNLLVSVYENEGIGIGFNKENDGNIIEDDQCSKQNLNLNENNKIKNKIELSDEPITCICLRSKCLNNYCSCHKNGNFCNENCRCVGCKNNDNSSNSLVERNKNKCKCQNSYCNSFYCDCKKRGELCNRNCLCVNCQNQTTYLKNINK